MVALEWLLGMVAAGRDHIQASPVRTLQQLPDKREPSAKREQGLTGRFYRAVAWERGSSNNREAAD